MRVLYYAGRSQLALHFMRGWRNAFIAMGDTFEELDPAAPDLEAQISTAKCDLILTASGEKIDRLPVGLLNEQGAAVVVNGLPFNVWGISPDIQAPCADAAEVQHLAQFQKKLVWSQWSPEFVSAFFSGYDRFGIPVLGLPYAGDVPVSPAFARRLADITDDMVFIGNLKHRRTGNLGLFRRLLASVPHERICIHGGEDWRRLLGISAQPTEIGADIADLYRRSLIAPNIHTARQREHLVQVNDRCFQIPASGGFQICDTPLIRDFFNDTEVVLAETQDDFVEKTMHYIQYPEETLPFVENAMRRVRRDHSHFNRIASVFEALGITGDVRIGDQTWLPFRYPDARNEGNITSHRKARYVVETLVMRLARSTRHKLRRR